MAEHSAISWTDATFNPWIGCAKVSPACDGCYAEALMGVGGRMGRAQWGSPGKGEGTRVRTAEANWKKPLSWNRRAEKNGTRPFVFCASLADVFDNAVPPEWRRDLFDLIRATPHLTWLLLTKRPGMIVKLYQEQHCLDLPATQQTIAKPLYTWPRNAAIGCTVVNQEEADRDVPKLLAAKAALNPAFAFLSMEPLLGPVDLTAVLYEPCPRAEDMMMDPETGQYECCSRCDFTGISDTPREDGLDWIITGGETDQGAHKARPADPDWFRSLRDQCGAAGVPFHFKQNGEWCEFGERGLLVDGSMNFLGRPDNKPHGWFAYGADDDVRIVTRVGKDRAGRFLDGATHDARPEVRA